MSPLKFAEFIDGCGVVMPDLEGSLSAKAACASGGACCLGSCMTEAGIWTPCCGTEVASPAFRTVCGAADGSCWCIMGVDLPDRDDGLGCMAVCGCPPPS